jgi:transposase
VICTCEAIPVAVEAFAGNTADPATVAPQVAKLKDRYEIDKLAWVGDRGMLTQARIDMLLRPAGLDWVCTLRAPQMAALAREKPNSPASSLITVTRSSGATPLAKRNWSSRAGADGTSLCTYA